MINLARGACGGAAAQCAQCGGWAMLGAIDVKRGCILFGFWLLALNKTSVGLVLMVNTHHCLTYTHTHTYIH